LQSLFGSLPTEEQRREASASFSELINFLTGLRDKFNALPTREDAAQVQPALSRLEELFRYAEKRSAIAQSNGAGQMPKRSSSRAASAKESEVDVPALVDAIKRLPADEITPKLNSRQYSVAIIKATASALGMKPSSREAKAVLIGRIVNYIENARMSDRLAGRTDSEWLLTGQNEALPKESAVASP